MKASRLTDPALAAVLKLSVVSVRAHWKGHLPVIRIGRMIRFDLDKVRASIQRNGHGSLGTVDTQDGAPPPRDRRRQPAARR